MMIGILPSEILPAQKPLSDSISAFFKNDTSGIWIDPNDTATILTGAAYRVPAQVEQTADVILDKSQGLALSSNLFTGTFTTLGAGWVNNGGGAYTGTTTAATSDISAVGSFILDAVYEVTVNLSNLSGTCTGYFTHTGGTPNLSNGINTFYTVCNHSSYIIIRLGTNSSVKVNSLSIRRVSGNHMLRYSGSNIPKLSARHNWLTYTEDFSNAAWVKTNVAASVYQGTSWKLVANTTSGVHRVQQVVADSGSHAFTAEFKPLGLDKLAITDSVVGTIVAYIDLSNGTQFGATNAYIELLEDGWVSVSFKYADTTSVVSRTWTITLLPNSATSSFGNTAWVGNNVSGVAIRSPRSVPTNTSVASVNTDYIVPAYQSVTSSTVYNTAGFPKYIAYTGVTGSAHYTPLLIDMSLYNRDLAMWVATTKFNDTTSVVAELSNGAGVVGQYSLVSGNVWATAEGFGATTFTDPVLNTASIAITIPAIAPYTTVLASFADIDEPLLTFKSHTIDPIDNVLPRGTNPYTSSKVILGCREGPSLFYKGNIYGFILKTGMCQEHHSVKAELYLSANLPTY